jgi:hypothetical protein
MTKFNGVLSVISMLVLLSGTNSTFADCEEVPEPIVDLLEEELSVEGGWLVKETARMFKSDDFQNIYFIAAEVQGKGKGGNGDIGLWAANSLDVGMGMVLSVNTEALEVSKWPNGKKSQMRLSNKNKGARKSMRCVAAATKK